MKSIFQSKPTVGAANPYRLDELVRTAYFRGLYIEVEFPVPTYDRSGPPIGYLVLYLFPNRITSTAVAIPDQGIQEMLEMIRKHKEYETAFRHKWPLLDSLLVDDLHQVTESACRPVLRWIVDPDDRLDKWMVVRQVTLPANALETEMTEIEMLALESVIEPNVRLQTEVQDAFVRVGTALIHKEFEFPKDRFEKFMEKYDKVEPIIGKILDFVKDSGIGR